MDVIWEGEEEGIEDDEVEESKVRVALNNEQMRKFRCDVVPPWRKKEASKEGSKQRKWSGPKRLKGHEARAKNLWRLQEKKKRRRHEAIDETKCLDGEINLLCELNG